MKHFQLKLTPEKILAQIEGRAKIVEHIELDNVAELTEADQHSVCFFENEKFKQDLLKSKPGLIFVPIDFDQTLKPKTNLIFVEKPYLYFMQFVEIWLKLAGSSEYKIAETAEIDASCKIGSNVNIGHNCVLEQNVVIGDNSYIDAHCVIKKNTIIGNGCRLFPNVTIYSDCIVKERVIIHSGCVIGADGFGYFFHENMQKKIPQVGNVVLENDVEIGANSTIDCSTIGSTVIGAGTKIDNLVQVGHNCKVGKHSILCAQVGLAGSTIIGNRVFLAGQVGVAGHLTIHDGVQVGAQSGVTKDIPENAKYFGTPAIEAGERKRILVSEKRLPELVRFYKNAKKREK